MTKYYKRLTKIAEFKTDGLSPSREKIQLQLKLKDDNKRIILNLQDVYYFPSNACNLMSLRLLNNSKIYYNNQNKTLYQLRSNRLLAQARHWRNSHCFKPLNLLDSIVFLSKIDDKTSEQLSYIFFNLLSSSTFLLLIIWHKRLGHIKFSSLKAYLKKLGVGYVDDSKSHIYNSCQ